MDRDNIRLLADIAGIVGSSRGPDETLQRIVEQVAARFGMEVCSVYLLNEEEEELVLEATVGLNPDAVHAVHMKLHEGLTGLVLEEMAPVFVVDPATHERYKFFEGSGEEIYKTFLGVPLLYLQHPVGVLVVQTVKESAVTEADIPVFSAIAGQIAATVAYTGLAEDLRTARGRQKPMESAPSQIERKRKTKKGLLRGIAVSPGIAEGRAHYLAESIGFDQIRDEKPKDVSQEVERLHKAFKGAEQEILELTGGARELSMEDQAILEAHVMLLRDKAFQKKITTHVKSGSTAEYALKLVVQEYVERFHDMDDPYLRERGADIENIGRWLLQNLFGIGGQQAGQFDSDTIIIASDISPVVLVGLRQDHLTGIVLARGGKTSHSAILAKSFEIPMVVGAKEILEVVKEDDFLIVDGTSGLVFDNPPQVIIDEFAHLKEEKAKQWRRLDLLRNAKAVTKDGREIKLGANIGLLSDLALVKKYGADHIGLYRTEFPFLARKDFPSEDEQYLLYEKIVRGAEQRSVTIRTLDVGGDKFLSYLDSPKEANPYLGWRSIRVSLSLEDIFKTQIRAILRASAIGKVRVLLPMITSVSEVRKSLDIVEKEKESLSGHGIPFDRDVPVGIMVEVPAAIRILDRLLGYVDFVSVGTNDLVQYLLAVDRNNERVADIYNPLHPAVVAAMMDIVSTCKRYDKKVSICGEAASNPQCAYLFLAMEVDRLSMAPASIPVIKDFVRKVTLKEAKETLGLALGMEDTEEISAFMEQTVGGVPGGS
ncbi:MAG: phosphoenolpyruvate--protein phosphotransferase [Thermodesulfobacteriota bacterium]|nr:phosphoenolpyruvate--protein phosphotransferase [Thermodesulfobacteriota bacterium]